MYIIEHHDQIKWLQDKIISIKMYVIEHHDQIKGLQDKISQHKDVHHWLLL